MSYEIEMLMSHEEKRETARFGAEHGLRTLSSVTVRKCLRYFLQYL